MIKETSFLTLKLWNKTKNADMTKIMIGLRKAKREEKKGKEEGLFRSCVTSQLWKVNR